MLQPPPSSTLFPYTTLFRSDLQGAEAHVADMERHCRILLAALAADQAFDLVGVHGGGFCHAHADRKSTRLNSSHRTISYAVFCLKKKMTWPFRRHATPSVVM